jgi:hypothetical protein
VAIVVYALASFSRIGALYQNYHASIDIWVNVSHLVTRFCTHLGGAYVKGKAGDRCYDFLNILAKKELAFLTQNKANFEKVDHNIGIF